MFVERKIHNEGWTGESSTKERFRLPEEKVLPFLRGEYTWERVRTLLLCFSLGSEMVSVNSVLSCLFTV